MGTVLDVAVDVVGGVEGAVGGGRGALYQLVLFKLREVYCGKQNYVEYCS